MTDKDMIRREASGFVFTCITNPRKVGSQFEATVHFIKRNDNV